MEEDSLDSTTVKEEDTFGFLQFGWFMIKCFSFSSFL